jgi:hypothetical protein
MSASSHSRLKHDMATNTASMSMLQRYMKKTTYETKITVTKLCNFLNIKPKFLSICCTNKFIFILPSPEKTSIRHPCCTGSNIPGRQTGCDASCQWLHGTEVVIHKQSLWGTGQQPVIYAFHLHEALCVVTV